MRSFNVSTAMPKTLPEWFAWQQELHVSDIELGLDRLRPIYQALLPMGPNYPVLTIAGTNGKGSCTAMASAMLAAAEYRVGVYTSPHLQRFSERICVNTAEISEADLIAAFTAVEQARRQAGGIAITQFEFATLAALAYFQRQSVDFAVLEVGLGGRLDAVNILDADVALITAISMDHQSWLGDSIDKIAVEKAGVARPQRPVVCSDPNAPKALFSELQRLGAVVIAASNPANKNRSDKSRSEKNYAHSVVGECFSFHGPHRQLDDLPLPALAGRHQLDHACAVIAALDELMPASSRELLSASAIAKGLKQVQIRGRLQRLEIDTGQTLLLDVAHNQASAELLAQSIAAMDDFNCHAAVFAVLKDKDLPAIAKPLLPLLQHWYVPELDDPRARPASDIAAELEQLGAKAVSQYGSVSEAVSMALADVDSLQPPVGLLVFGSFSLVGPALDCLGQ